MKTVVLVYRRWTGEFRGGWDVWPDWVSGQVGSVQWTDRFTVAVGFASSNYPPVTGRYAEYHSSGILVDATQPWSVMTLPITYGYPPTTAPRVTGPLYVAVQGNEIFLACAWRFTTSIYETGILKLRRSTGAVIGQWRNTSMGYSNALAVRHALLANGHVYMNARFMLAGYLAEVNPATMTAEAFYALGLGDPEVYGSFAPQSYGLAIGEASGDLYHVGALGSEDDHGAYGIQRGAFPAPGWYVPFGPATLRMNQSYPTVPEDVSSIYQATVPHANIDVDEEQDTVVEHAPYELSTEWWGPPYGGYVYDAHHIERRWDGSVICRGEVPWTLNEEGEVVKIPVARTLDVTYSPRDVYVLAMVESSETLQPPDPYPEGERTGFLWQRPESVV